MKRAGTKGARLPCVVSVFPLLVTEVAEKWPESRQRKRRWMPLAMAVAQVDNPELARILHDFDPDAPRLPQPLASLNFPEI